MPTPDVFDAGLLAPVTVGHDASVSDAAVLAALVTAEVALTRAWGAVGAAPAEVVDAVGDAFGWAGQGDLCATAEIDVRALAEASVSGGNPVIPLVAVLKARLPEPARAWVHRAATSQDVLDSALMLVARRAGKEVLASLAHTEDALADLATAHRDDVGAARTLTQHAVPTTMGLRAAGWMRGVRRARRRLDAALDALPASLAGAGGTLASAVELAGPDAASALPVAFAAELGLSASEAPWHTSRGPVTELGDTLVQSIDAVGKIATDVATLARTEIGELAEGGAGGSSAMPQKQNPTASVLIRSAALRAPQLGATLHLAAALAADERPDGAWHAEWPTLRELLRLALGATATAAGLVRGIMVDREAVAANLARTDGLIVSERVGLVLRPLIGAERFDTLIADAWAGGDLARLVAALPEASGIDIAALLDPRAYTGLAGILVDDAVRGAREEDAHS